MPVLSLAVSAMTEVITFDRSNPSLSALTRASEILQRGGLVAFPTDTVYGLAANLLSGEAVERMYELKQRSKEIPLPVLLPDVNDLDLHIGEIPETAQRLISAYWPGPLTLLFECDRGPFKGKKMGFRVPDDEIAIRILKLSKIPITCPSANPVGRPNPRTAREVLEFFDGKIDLLIDAGPTKLGKESTVVECVEKKVRFLRYGFISQELVDTCLNRPVLEKGKIKNILFVCTGNSCRSVMAEGLCNKFAQGKKNVRAISAGTIAIPGIRPSENAVVAMKEEGADISGHRSQPLSAELIDSADIVIAMTRAHRRFTLEIANNFTLDSKKVFLLMEFASRWDFFGVDVEDPIGQPLWAYQNCLGMMRDPIQRLVDMV